MRYSVFRSNLNFDATGGTAYFDADKIKYPLLLRRWKIGDYFYPLGLKKKHSDKPGKKKVSDLLTDKKLDILQKENTWILLSGDQIIWVVGIRQDGRMAVSKSTKQLLKVTLAPLS